MTTKAMARSAVAVAALLGAIDAGCGSSDSIREALATENPARPEAAAGAPPVAPERLQIEPPSLPPTEAPAIAPERVHPMDDGYKGRRMPDDAGILDDGGRVKS